LAANPVPLAMGQRIDLMLTIPASGAFPILAQVETTTHRTGLILATAGAKIPKLSSTADATVPEVDLSVEARLSTLTPLADKPATRMPLTLGMEPGYRWTINGMAMGEMQPMMATQDSRVEITFQNPSMMMHPMHLHGHHFQVVDLGSGRFSGALRDVVIVPPMATVTVAVDFNNPGDWFLHCHNLYHMAAGMMTSVRVA
jgi:FtsP/CotA-like multicopper oxidase with cupredoxin domain